MTTGVFISGATGYIAQHIIQLLLSKQYRVIGSVRSIEKGDRLKSLFCSELFSYEVVPAMETLNAFDQALQKHPEVTVFLHTASPINFNSRDIENDLLFPALNGTKNVFSAIKKFAPQIKHVVVTSSLAAHYDPSRGNDPTYIMYEDTWSPLTWAQAKTSPVLGYYGSKTFAEKAAWDIYKEDSPSFTLNAVNPVYVFGPQAFDENVKDVLNFSAEVTNQLLKLSSDSEIPKIEGAFLDVRDVAKAHVAAFEEGFSNQRLLLRTDSFSSQKLLDILNDNFEILRGKLPIGKPGSHSGDSGAKIDNEKTRKLLLIPWIDLSTSAVDAVTQILKNRNLVV